MKAARAPREDKSSVRLLVVMQDGDAGKYTILDSSPDTSIDRLVDYLRSGDLLVVNDAATLPASFHGLYGHGVAAHQVEFRLMTQLDEQTWRAVAFGSGDWRMPTEDRPAPPPFEMGEEIRIAENFRARVRGLVSVSGPVSLSDARSTPISKRLLELEFNLSGEALWRDLYRYGKPVQYSYLKDELKLWSTQNVYSSRPWAVEMPSAGHALNWRLLLKLIKKGVQIVPLTHGAGLSSTGEANIDQALPLAERFEIPAGTREAVLRTRAAAGTAGGRVIAVGTSVVRALESASLGLEGITNLKLGPGYERKVVDGLLTGTHDVSESHYQLLRAFLPEHVLSRVSRHLEEREYLTHEFGDLCLILAAP